MGMPRSDYRGETALGHAARTERANTLFLATRDQGRLI